MMSVAKVTDGRPSTEAGSGDRNETPREDDVGNSVEESRVARLRKLQEFREQQKAKSEAVWEKIQKWQEGRSVVRRTPLKLDVWATSRKAQEEAMAMARSRRGENKKKENF